MDAIIQARLGSKRLPKKSLLSIQGRPLIGHCIDRIKEIKSIDKIIIATTSESIDDQIEQFCRAEKIMCYRGSELNVLNRFIEASIEYKTDRFLRICGDNPFIDIKLVRAQIESIEESDDYCSYFTKTGENAIIKPVGFFVEAVTREALEKASQLGAEDPMTQEHVTYYIYNHPESFNIKKLQIPSYINPDLRFTIDYSEDIYVAEYILNKINKTDAKKITNLVNSDNILYQMINRIANSKPKTY